MDPAMNSGGKDTGIGRFPRLLGVGVLALCFGLALYQVGRTLFERSAEEGSTIRFAHHGIYDPVRRYYDTAFGDYERLNPGVKVAENAVPRRVWTLWRRTQLVGGNAPSIIGLSGASDDELVRFFLPLGDFAALPNPYNAGTELEGVAWKDTFLNGLSGPPSFHQGMQEIYGIPTGSYTYRIFFNRDLLEETTGLREAPETFTELMEACRAIDAQGARSGRKIVAFAGSEDHAEYLFSLLFQQITERLAIRINWNSDLSLSAQIAAIAYLRDEWSHRDGAVKAGWRLIQEIGGFFQPSFLHQKRDDAIFYFMQEHSVMILSGNWDANEIMLQAQFPVGVFRLPHLPAEQPEFEDHVFGPVAEASDFVAAPFGIARSAPDKDRAVDLLMYLTSKQAAAQRAEMAFSLPSTIGVAMRGELEVFMPEPEGGVPGFFPVFPGFGGGNANRLYRTHAYRLFDRSRPVDDFVDALESQFRTALMSDMRIAVERTWQFIRQIDAASFALGERLGQRPGDRAGRERLARIVESQDLQEVAALQMAYELGRAASK